MNQYPNEKDPHSSWLYPPPTQGPYTSRDGAPPPAPGGYASSSQYHAPPGPPPPPPQEYYPPLQAPPPGYDYVQAHPQEGSYQDPRTSPQPYPATSSARGPSPYGAAAPPPDAGPSSQDPNNSGMSLGAFFGNKGPPPMWHRQPPSMGQLPYNAFPPMCLISNGKDLSSGFPELPPPCQMNPHPFATHDVAEEDWKRFLADIKKSGSLSPAQRIKSNVIPMVTGMGFISGFFMTNAIEKKMKFKNRHAAGDLVDHWNHYFFGPRRMEVVLCQASERLSGRMGAAPIGDPNQTRMAQGLRQRTNDSSSDDSSDDDGRHHGHGHGNAGMSDRQNRRAARRERRADRRERKAERRERKARGDYQEPYQLFITSV